MNQSWHTHHSDGWVMSHVSQCGVYMLRTTRMSHVTHTSDYHIWMSHVTRIAHMNGSSHTYFHTKDSCHTYIWWPHVDESRHTITLTDESCHTYCAHECDMSRVLHIRMSPITLIIIWMSHVTQISDDHTWMSHVTQKSDDHIWVSRVTHVTVRWMCSDDHIRMGHVTHVTFMDIHVARIAIWMSHVTHITVHRMCFDNPDIDAELRVTRLIHTWGWDIRGNQIHVRRDSFVHSHTL